MAASPLSSRAFVLIVCHPLTGHITPLLGVAAALLERNWAVGFLGPTTHRARIESSGAEFFQLRGKADLDDSLLLSTNPPVANYHELSPRERVLVDTRVQCLDTIPDQWASIKETLAALHQRRWEDGRPRQIVVVCEAFVYGILPMKYGAPLPPGVSPPRSVCVSVTPPMIRTRAQPPFGYSLPYDPSPAGAAQSAALWDEWIATARDATEYLDRKLREAGSPRAAGLPFFAGANYICHDAILQIGLPSFEYPRDDWPPGFSFAGIIPPAATGGGAGAPTDTAERARIPWWGAFVANASLSRRDPARRHVLVVTQGTVEIDHNELIIPTIRAVADLEGVADVVLVVILGVKGRTLPADVVLPANVLVVDYLGYGAVLPYADVWVHNGGYGAVTQGIAAGVPCVVAGEGQDKPENARRVGWSGIGVDLKTALPSAAQVKEALLAVLREDGYRESVGAMRHEMEQWRFGDLVEAAVVKLLK